MPRTATFVTHLQRQLDERTTPRYLRLIALSIIVVQLCLLLVTFVTQEQYQTIFGPLLGADFSSFYTAGTIFHEHAPAAVYLGDLQDTTYHQLFPTAPANTRLPYANAPFLTLLFALLARLPYPMAYLSWLILSLLLYLIGYLLLWQTLDALPRQHKFTMLLLALSFMPFMVEAWVGGQTSLLAFCAIALAIYLERHQRLLWSGGLLAICLYKPTLLLLLLPMLLLTRRWRTIVGFAIGGTLLGLLSWLAVGTAGLFNYVDMLLFFKDAAVSAETGLRLVKYIDVNAFSRLLLAGYPTGHLVVAGTLWAAGVLALAWRWWQMPWAAATVDHPTQADQLDQNSMAWALAITGTLVLNLYVGVYEAPLLVLSLLLFTDLGYRRAQSMNNGPIASDTGVKLTSVQAISEPYKLLLVLLYLTPWVSQWLAQVLGLQLFTVVLCALGIYQWQQSRTSRVGDAQVAQVAHLNPQQLTN